MKKSIAKKGSKTFVLGDVHGGYRALLQCFERAKFNYKKDILIVLGDVCDGWPEVKECYDELLKIKNLFYIIGNHDYWALEWYRGDYIYGGIPNIYWTSQGGQATIDSYGGINWKMDDEHLSMISNGHVALEDTIDGKKVLFCHGGIEPNKDLSNQDPQDVMWDRELFNIAKRKHCSKSHYKYGGYDDIFIGHTTTRSVGGCMTPLHYCNVWNLDTGGGWGGKLTIMDVVTKEYWQSDFVYTLYPDIPGRGRKY